MFVATGCIIGKHHRRAHNTPCCTITWGSMESWSGWDCHFGLLGKAWTKMVAPMPHGHDPAVHFGQRARRKPMPTASFPLGFPCQASAASAEPKAMLQESQPLSWPHLKRSKMSSFLLPLTHPLTQSLTQTAGFLLVFCWLFHVISLVFCHPREQHLGRSH